MTLPPRDTLVASERHIDVWLAYYHDIADPELHRNYRALLTEEERGKEFRFYFPDDQRRYLVTRALVRTVLSRYLHVQPTDWRFANNRYGRPEIANLSRDECGLSFNISHTRGLIALGVTKHRELGVDVENLRTREVALGVADRFFAKTEVDELATVPKERQQDRFFEYWTFKESYIKARGMGLSIPLGQFSFHYPHERAVNLAVAPELGDDASRWSFWQYRPTDEYLMAVCAERRAEGAPTIALRKVVPLVGEEGVEARVLKTSEGI
ncbi:4'-phosphopantetheinyl transferase family protein [Steroidobacter agaridevorans]|uniref:4'-phosphopantetheinyl transferase family protein n=1 Tax=Steroidobacter agaridevorans TaxID=2695856 RepID=UPI001327F2C3|nr:4'-phosphopantetheinyl transferase superfamily protein [Steroidobacter agaridevorans]GFE85704.1 4'-phosphopantetheinyl transferase [Steroidobacter agaridevorans]